MNILVCIKQVPDMESRFSPNDAGTWYREDGLVFRMNDYDTYAVEEAVRLKERLGGEPQVTVLSIGADRVAEVLRKALAMGCDRGVHVRDAQASLKDPWQIASLIAAYARHMRFDLIFTGMQSEDRGSAQVGVLVAELLGYPGVSTIVDFAWNDGVVTVSRELEGGLRGEVTLGLPALFTCQLGLNSPRYPTLPNILKAKKKEITVLLPETLSEPQPLVSTLSFRQASRKGTGIILDGAVEEMAEMVIDILDERTTILRNKGGLG